MNWIKRHPKWSITIVVLVVLIAIGAAGSGGGDDKTTAKSGHDITLKTNTSTQDTVSSSAPAQPKPSDPGWLHSMKGYVFMKDGHYVVSYARNWQVNAVLKDNQAFINGATRQGFTVAAVQQAITDHLVNGEPAPPLPLRPKPKPVVTAAQSNALRKARDYLGYDAFSARGLVDQLKYEGFSTADAQWAVDHVGADWKKEAADKAKEYLDYDSFSYSGLVGQLEYEGFTPEQAEYGAHKAGL